jgi:sulfite reductase (ferredoxin)
MPERRSRLEQIGARLHAGTFRPNRRDRCSLRYVLFLDRKYRLYGILLPMNHAETPAGQLYQPQHQPPHEPTVTHFENPSGPESVKAESRHLRGSLRDDIADSTTGGVSHDSEVLLKFHGIYAQDNRDRRKALKAAAGDGAAAGKEHIYMIRASVPGGVLTGEQWLAMDRLTDQLADGTLRVTTRQGVQWHFVGKGDLQPLIRTLNEHLVTTLAACGDVSRNVQCCPAPLADRRQHELGSIAARLAKRFRPQTKAYYDVWIDGEHAATAAPASPAPVESQGGVESEPVYGDTYLPRKFKMGIAWPGDNCIDVYANDFGVIPARHPELGAGFVVVVGGGMGQAHNRDDTYPRLATPLGWVPEDVDGQHLGDVAEAVITAFRDHGDREDRKRARLKYLIDDRGMEWFRAEVESRLGHPLVDPIDVAPWIEADDHVGWFEQADGGWVLGVHVDAGRVKDTEAVRMRAAFRTVIEQFGLGVHLTARQDVLLTGIRTEDKSAVEAVLHDHGVTLHDELSALRRHGIACPALPTCGQALAEAERVLPRTIQEVQSALDSAGLGTLPVHIRMTGCPNGCARPYTAELGIIGRTKSGYDIHVGGSIAGTRLNSKIAQGVKLAELPKVLGPIFDRYRSEAGPGEGFGDFCHRADIAGSAVLSDVVDLTDEVGQPSGLSDEVKS